MALHPEIRRFLDSLPKSAPSQTINVEEQRKVLVSGLIPEEQRVPVEKIEDQVIHTPNVDIPIRIYTPEGNGPFPILMFFHGGGFLGGTIESHDQIARPLAVETGHKVITVGYRLAPEHPFPAGLMDCYEATKWAAEHTEELNADGVNLAVIGNSAGGNLSAAVSLLARDRKEFNVTKQVLLYPSLDLDVSEFRYSTLTEFGKGYGLEADQLEGYYVHYLQNDQDPNDPLVSPVKAKDFSNLPPALVVTAECDVFRDEGELFAKNLIDAGVPVETKRYIGANHGFVEHFIHLEEFSGIYKVIANFLNRELF